MLNKSDTVVVNVYYDLDFNDYTHNGTLIKDLEQFIHDCIKRYPDMLVEVKIHPYCKAY